MPYSNLGERDKRVLQYLLDGDLEGVGSSTKISSSMKDTNYYAGVMSISLAN
jgi:hypothetical protein